MTSRRDFLKYASAVALCATQNVARAQDRQALPTRSVPGSDEQIAVIGLGNSQAFRNGDRETSRQLLELFLEHGGHYVDAGGTSAHLVGEIGRALGRSSQLFLGNYIDPGADYHAEVRALLAAQGKEALDLVHTRDLEGFRGNHASYRALQEQGLVRHIGIARTGADGFPAIIQLIEDGLVDFIQVNYSMLEPQAAERLLPLAADRGVGVAISRPFINGEYFSIVKGQKLPEWAAEFDCDSWAQFSLKYILAHPAVTCVLTETANPRHAMDNLGAGYGRLPDAQMRQRMLEHMRSLV